MSIASLAFESTFKNRTRYPLQA